MKPPSALKRSTAILAVLLLSLVLAPVHAMAAETSALNTGDTAWMLTSSALVLFMTIPGLALFYGGLVRRKNVLSVLMQCFAATGLVTVLWVICGYSLAFDTTGMQKGVVNFHSFIGSFHKAFFSGVTINSMSGTIPETVFAMFQLTFAIITPALIVGGFAERMKFSALMVFIGCWSLIVYSPICHMVWAGDGSFFGDHFGAMDFAGGTVVHINSGVAALMACLVIGKRAGFPGTQMMPHNLTYTVMGAAMLWVGWFGFNAGSALQANGLAGMAMLVTQICTAVGALTWMGLEWVKHGKPSVLGTASGAVAGLVAITPASGFVGVPGALVIGVVATCFCFFAVTKVKQKFGYDDSLDVFGVHGVGGIVGALMTGIFVAPSLGGLGTPGMSISHQFLMQAITVGITLAYSGIVSYILLVIIDKIIGLRVTPEAENTGLDLTLHDEHGYDF